MKKIFEVFLEVFLMLFFVILITGAVSAALDTENAKSYKSDVIAEIENSNFSDTVISECISQAAEEGYTLTVNKIVTDAATNKQIAEVVLKYKYTFSLLGIDNEHQTRGIAK